MSFASLPVTLSRWLVRLASVLDRRAAPRFAALLLGVLLATGRRTVSSWIRASGQSDSCRNAYAALASAGRRPDSVAVRLLTGPLKPLLPASGRVPLAIDDTPTPRHGPHVRGAGSRHAPTPGPAGGRFLYGHSWVTLAWLAEHPHSGTVAMPLLARLYAREKDPPAVPEPDRPPFRTKLGLAVGLLKWARPWLAKGGVSLWAAVDGASAKAKFLKPAKALGVTVVSRPREDAALWSVPGAKPEGRRGPQATYGRGRISLAEHGSRECGWTKGEFELYGGKVVKGTKTFVATWGPAGGAIRVVMAREKGGWVAFLCTDTGATVADVLGAVARRFSLETAFRDVKRVGGAGQRQVRKWSANVGAFDACLWAFSVTEAWAWERPAGESADRSGSPWDDADRRPSHADKRRALRRELLAGEIRAALAGRMSDEGFAALAERLLDLAA